MSPEEYAIEEYKALRIELMALTAESRQLEILALVAIGGLYSWFVTQSLVFGIVWFVPTLFPLLSGLRAYSLYQRLKDIGHYLYQNEKKWQCLGWENYFSTQVKGRIANTAFIYWLTLLLVTLISPWFIA